MAGALDTPCIGVCEMDSRRDMCLGCGRTLLEIARWAGLTPAERTKILAEIPARFDSL